MTEEQLLVVIRHSERASAVRWESAIANDDSDRGFPADAEACEAAYEAAIEALEDCYEDYLGVVRTHLDEAEELEAQVGDGQDARRALDALNELLASNEP